MTRGRGGTAGGPGRGGVGGERAAGSSRSLSGFLTAHPGREDSLCLGVAWEAVGGEEGAERGAKANVAAGGPQRPLPSLVLSGQ